MLDLDVHEPVIFRTWPNGETIALFPATPSTADGVACESYAHVGQHGGANYAYVVRKTRPATDAERMPLQSELERLGYGNLIEYDRAQQFMHDARREAATQH